MAIIKSPLLTASFGSIGDVTFRRVNGRIIASRKRCARTSLSAGQRVTVTYFGMAVKCLEYLPAYARTSYSKIGHKSGWNIACSIAARALRAQVPVLDPNPSAVLLLSAMKRQGVQPSIGRQEPATAAWSDGNVTVTCPTADRVYLWAVGSDSSKMAAVTDGVIGDDGSCVLPVPAGTAAAVVVALMADGTPVTSDSSFINLIN